MDHVVWHTYRVDSDYVSRADVTNREAACTASYARSRGESTGVRGLIKRTMGEISRETDRG